MSFISRSLKRGSDSKRGSYTAVATRESSPSRSRDTSPTSVSIIAAPRQGPISKPIPAPQVEEVQDIDGRTELEKQLFELVIKKDAKGVENFLRSNKVDINQRDTERLSILHHAVINNDEATVDVLLRDNFEIDIHDALLQAVKDNLVPLVLKIWKWRGGKRRKKVQTKILQNAYPNNSRIKNLNYKHEDFYDEDMTPILMAAICGHYELIEFFYDKGERINELPSNSASMDLRLSNNRIHMLKGLTSPAYMAFRAGREKAFDPIGEAFRLIKKLTTCIDEEPEFKDEYEQILKNIKQFPVSLLGLCQNSEETEILLSKKEGYTGVSSIECPRLMLAIDLGEKEFVAHTNAQDVMHQKWVKEPWVTETNFEHFLKTFSLILMFLTYPLISLLLWCTCGCCSDTKLVRFLTSPVNRFRGSLSSQLWFLGILFWISTEQKPTGASGPPMASYYYVPTVVVVIFVISHLISFVKHSFVSSSPMYFFSNGWNLFELWNYKFFFLTFVFWILLCVNQPINLRELRSPSDILMLSEISLAIASTMAGLRLMKCFILHKTLGPLQIALGKMSEDISTFIKFFAIIIISFSLGVQHLYRPYEETQENHNFCYISSTIETFFWALFTMSDASTPVITPTRLTDRRGHGLINNHYLTQSVGKIIFVVYHILGITFLFNMLTGVMSSTYGNILSNVNTEWKYGRTRMYVHYIHDTTLISPINICPNFENIFKWLRATMSSKKEGQRQTVRPVWNCADCCYVEDVDMDETEKEKAYSLLMRRLLQRYFRFVNSLASEDAPVAEDIKTVKNLVAELRELSSKTLEYNSNPNSGTSIITNKKSPPKQSPPLSRVSSANISNAGTVITNQPLPSRNSVMKNSVNKPK